MSYDQIIEDDAVSSLRLYENIQLLERTSVSVYLGPCGIYAVTQTAEDPEKLYLALRKTLGTTKLRLYISDSGLYDPMHGVIGRAFNSESLLETIEKWTCAGYTLWDEAELDDFADRLYRADGLCRGKYTDKDGNSYILRGSSFYPASPMSSSTMFYLTLFTGVLGFHRFYSGKFFTGLLYFCTGGLLGLGWLLDLLSLCFGAMKDSMKRYYEPLRSLPKKLLTIPLGLVVGALILCLQFRLSYALLNALNLSFTASLQNADPASAIQLKYSIQKIIQKILAFFG